MSVGGGRALSQIGADGSGAEPSSPGRARMLGKDVARSYRNLAGAGLDQSRLTRTLPADAFEPTSRSARAAD
eukprot:6715843-Prymnesium_polylepis.1